MWWISGHLSKSLGQSMPSLMLPEVVPKSHGNKGPAAAAPAEANIGARLCLRDGFLGRSNLDRTRHVSNCAADGSSKLLRQFTFDELFSPTGPVPRNVSPGAGGFHDLPGNVPADHSSPGWCRGRRVCMPFFPGFLLTGST